MALLLGAVTAMGAEDKVVARVNGVAITAAQLDREVDRLIPLSTYHRNVTEERRKQISETALENLLTRELQIQDAADRGVKPDKKKVKEQIEEIRKRYPSKKEYKAALERSHFTEESLKREIEGLLVVQALYEQVVVKPSQMSDEALKKYYDENQEKFRMPESVKLRLMSLWDEKKAKDAAAKVKGGELFEAVAERESEDKYRVVGGDVGWMHRGQLVEALEDAVFAAPVNVVQGPLKAEGIWYLFVVEEKKPPYLRSFDESKEKLKKELELKRVQELQKAWIDGLRSKAKIEIVQEQAAPAAQK
jgi:peptidyl-prolyl cis-trans isomerase C